MQKSEPVIEYSKTFQKQLAKAPAAILKAFKKRRSLFLVDPLHPMLHNHKVKGAYEGMKSINVTGDWRALFREREVGTNKVIIFEFLGTHSQLYK